MRLADEGMRRRSVDEKGCVLGSIHLDVGMGRMEKYSSASDRTGHDRFHARRLRTASDQQYRRVDELAAC